MDYDDMHSPRLLSDKAPISETIGGILLLVGILWWVPLVAWALLFR